MCVVPGEPPRSLFSKSIFFKEPVLHTLTQSGRWGARDLEMCKELIN
jgi:hypothetical protein